LLACCVTPAERALASFPFTHRTQRSYCCWLLPRMPTADLLCLPGQACIAPASSLTWVSCLLDLLRALHHAVRAATDPLHSPLR
jgi:hypothetical protein